MQTEQSIYSNIPSAKNCSLAGLSQKEVAAQINAGNVNKDSNPKEKSVARIFSENLLTLFNFINVFLAILVFITGSYRNMLFMLVVFCNVVIGITQELRARKALSRLSLFVCEKIMVVRSGEEDQIPPDQIVLGDVLKLGTGQQIPCDCRVLEGNAQVNEALLTGEADLVPKHAGDALLSGSFIGAGEVLAQAVAVGAESFAANITSQVKSYKKPESQIMATLQYIIKIATFYLIPVGIILFLRTYFSSTTGEVGAQNILNTSILTTVAALVGMIPQGLVLLTSAVLTLSVIRLAAKKVLVKQFYSIETLARVDVLCLDKTGTITSGNMQVENVYSQKPYSDEQVLEAAYAVMWANRKDANATAKAIMKKARSTEAESDKGKRKRGGAKEKDQLQEFFSQQIKISVPFLSEKKFSGVELENGECFVVGAEEFIFSGSPLESKLLTKENERLPLKENSALLNPPKRADKTERLLCVAKVEGFSKDGEIQGKPQLMGWIGLSDELRPGISETLNFFERQNVRLLILSGDNPETAAAIAQKAGLKPVPGQERIRFIDAQELLTNQAIKTQKIKQVLKDVSVIGRCTPQIKQAVLNALKEENHTTAMTGDGVNDILAMRAADTSIAMAQGAQAARVVGELVLVDNDFSHVPSVVDEGRRSINNLIRSASLFLEKTVFSMALAAFALFLPPYPMLPIQLTLVSGALIGIPSFLLALEPNRKRVQGNFFQNVFGKALPASLAITLGIAAVMVYAEVAKISNTCLSTFATLIICTVGLALLVYISKPLNLFRSFLVIFLMGLLVFCIFVFGWFFEIQLLSLSELLICLVFCACAFLLYLGAIKMFKTKRFQKTLGKFASKIAP